MTQPVITIVGSFAVGMTMRTSRMPIFGETFFGADFDMGPGGKGSNQAVAAARLGAHASLAGIIGDDRLGEIAIDLYASEGVDTSYLEITPQRATGVGFIILNQQGENGILLDMGANMLMDADFVDTIETQIARSDIVMTVLELPTAAAARAVELGRKHGVRTILNPAPATLLDRAVLHNVDYLTPNETELRILLGLPPDDPTPTVRLAERLQEQGVANLVVTCGERGALVLSPSGQYEVPSLAPPGPIVDTTGAGDAFNAGLAVALSEGRDLLAAVRFGCCCGALACTQMGVIPALAHRDQVDQLFAEVHS
ncbi:MAG: ribokinase [Anaerolineae bacterium]|nr:ribokinase [Anaerolineae bacterium]